NSRRSFSYQVRFEITDNKPHAAFSYTRTGNELGFMNESKNTDRFIWRIGNQTTTVTYPLQELTTGFYPVQLIATNGVCNYNDTAKKEITVSGIESFTPNEAGVGGDFILNIYGGGLVEDTRVSLLAN